MLKDITAIIVAEITKDRNISYIMVEIRDKAIKEDTFIATTMKRLTLILMDSGHNLNAIIRVKLFTHLEC